ncbi:MAG: ATP-binding cassette domain-containing protein, partial [Pseudomonadota bacterium]
AALGARSVALWQRGVWSVLLTVTASLLIALPSLGVIATRAPLAALVLLALLAGVVWTVYAIARRQVRTLLDGPQTPVGWMASAFEALSQLETLRAFNAETRFFVRWADSFMPLQERQLASDRVGTATLALRASLGALMLGVAIVCVTLLANDLPTGAMVAFIMATMTVTGSAVALADAFSQATMLGLQRKLIKPIMEATPPRPHTAQVLRNLTGAIEAVEVSFRRAPDAPRVLDRVSLIARPGEQIGIAGPSGSGKSTLLHILLGLLTSEAGQVLVDGHDLSKIDEAGFRRQIGVVGQAGKLFPGSLMENIAAGVPLTIDQAWEALAKAAMEAEVQDMPLGLATPIGDADPALSGGQVQRILLARAFAQQQRLIVLDEATSALDPQAQAIVTRSLNAHKATVISVAHHLSTLAHCDRIYVLDGGRVVETGSHAELAAKGGLFARMLQAQAGAGHRPAVPENAVRAQQERLAECLSE